MQITIWSRVVAFLLASILILGFAPVATRAAGNTVTISKTTSQMTLGNSCTGETINFEVTSHNKVTIKTNTDGSTHFDADIVAHGLGEAEGTGDHYVWNAHFNTSFDDPTGNAFTLVSTQKIRLIGSGPSDNDQFFSLFELLIDENGNLTINIDADDRCVG